MTATHWLHGIKCKYPSCTTQNLCLTLRVSKDDQENEDGLHSYPHWRDSSRIISTFLTVLFLLKMCNPVVSSKFRNSFFSSNCKTLQHETISPETKLLPWLSGHHILSLGGGGWIPTASPMLESEQEFLFPLKLYSNFISFTVPSWTFILILPSYPVYLIHTFTQTEPCASWGYQQCLIEQNNHLLCFS